MLNALFLIIKYYVTSQYNIKKINI